MISPGLPIRQAGKFTSAGAWFDGWETRRHNPEPFDWVIIKLGVKSSTVVGVEVDTAYFNGNNAPAISVDATYISPEKLAGLDEKEALQDKNVQWEEVISQQPCGPSQRHFFVREDGPTSNVFNYVKLKMYPDGGIARFRLYGMPTAVKPSDPNQEIDLAHVTNGGVAIKFSDQHFGSVDNLLIPGRGVNMGDGWETKRSREPGHVDYVIIKLGLAGYIDRVIVDTIHFLGNFPQSVKVDALNLASGEDENEITRDDKRWVSVVPQTAAGRGQIHEFIREGAQPVAAVSTEIDGPKVAFNVLQSGKDDVYTHVKLTMIPDGGVKRLRIYGRAKLD